MQRQKNTRPYPRKRVQRPSTLFDYYNLAIPSSQPTSQPTEQFLTPPVNENSSKN
ncbi:hypothetical protein B9Z19DRAFT_1083235 [Tuber borchii]|uniref:Uncharacterized protein n=1 Tax=Tuber borchii TaxID=42251 RepID=A0A2T6ZTS3_TUBBO|nr:hypothetical protein B9Z19DRAFT_1083235 [Tuber borchii]